MPLIPLFIGGTSTSLVIQDAVSASSGDNVVLVQVQILIVQDGLSGSSSDNVVLTQVTVLAVQDSTSASSADEITLAGEFATTETGGGVPSKKRKRRRIIEEIAPIIPEAQELPEEPKRKPHKVEIKKYEMLDIPKVISEGWKPKEKYKETLEAKAIESLLPKQEKKEPAIDFAALERELTEAVKRKRIQDQNNLIMLLAMEEA